MQSNDHKRRQRGRCKTNLRYYGLGAKQGQEIVLKTEGADEDAAMDKLSAFLEANL